MAEVRDTRRITLEIEQLGTDSLFNVRELLEFADKLRDAEANPDWPVRSLKSDMGYQSQGLLVEWNYHV